MNTSQKREQPADVSSGAHTAGPWCIGYQFIDGQTAIIGDIDSVVATIPDETVGCTYNAANARLIAAAPTMLEALRELQRTAEGFRREVFTKFPDAIEACEGWTAALSYRLIEARKAVPAATGAAQS